MTEMTHRDLAIQNIDELPRSKSLAARAVKRHASPLDMSSGQP